jgi:subtilisin family serine protease
MPSSPLAYACTLCLTVLLVCGCNVRAADPVPAAATATTSPALHGSDEDVIVSFREGAATLQALRSNPNARPGVRVRRAFRGVPAVALTLTPQALERLRIDPEVTHVQEDGRGEGQLKEAVPAIGGDRVKSILGLTGKGVRVAVLDTGIVTQHPDLSDAVVAQHCFTQRACPPLRTAESESAEDDHGHGSNVAGAIASNGKVSSAGFAPDVELVAVKINDANDSGYESDWVAGFDWVYDNLSTLKVQIVNASIGTTATHATQAECDQAHPALRQAIDNLVQAGVTVFVASGNGGLTDRLPAPACLSGGHIVVGATYDTSIGRQPEGNYATFAARWSGFGRCADATTAFDQIACFTNSTSRVDIVAPGAQILSDSLRNRTEVYMGTSQASGVAAGVGALMLQCNPRLTPAELKAAMQGSGPEVTDLKNDLRFPSLRAFEAVSAACPDLPGATPVAAADAGMDDPDDPDDPEPEPMGGKRSDAGTTTKPSGRDAGKAALRDAGKKPTSTKQSDEEGEQDSEHDDEAAPGRGNGSDGTSSDDGELPASAAREGGCSAAPGTPAPLDLSVWFALLALPLVAGRARARERLRLTINRARN